MLYSDVAMLYHYETKKINQTVKRNFERFPEKFCFQLTEDELENLRSQFVTSSLKKDNTDVSKENSFIREIAQNAGIDIEHEDINELIYIMNCAIFQDPL